MSNGNHNVRMDFKAENEFLKIRDAFNYMAVKLEESEREKHKIEENRKRMFMDISHDLKTPITTICGYVKALDEGLVQDEERKKRYLHTIHEKSLRVTNLINNLFELSKLENTEIRLKKEKYDVVEFLRGIVAEYYEQIEEKRFILDLILPVGKISCDFDRKEMGRVLSNLLNNALEYNSEGTKIRIELKEIEEKIIIEIADNGVGIPEKLKEIIFEPFVRGDINRSSDGGTGLGLAIAKKIVEAHGGILNLCTNEGENKTIFRIIICKIY